jgi:hypothetical protein
MACAALMDQQTQPKYFTLLDKPSPPSVRNLQQWIETAWKSGELCSWEGALTREVSEMR